MNITTQSAGNVLIAQYDKDGRLLQRERVHNLMTTIGGTYLLNHTQGLLTNRLAFVRFGISAQTTTPNMTQLVTPVGFFYPVNYPSSPSSASAVYEAYIATDQGNGNTYYEVGLYWTNSNGGDNSLFARATFTPVTKTVDTALTITWTLTIGGV